MPTNKEKLAGIQQALDKLPTYDWVFFTSVNGVEFFFKHLKERGQDIRSLASARIVAVGPGTANALGNYGIAAEVLKERFQAEGIIDAYSAELQPGQHVLLPRGDLARSWLPEKLTEMGLHVTEAVLYENVLYGEDDDELLKLLQEGGIHAVTFTSSSTVTHLLEVLRGMGVSRPTELLKGLTIACIGPLTAQTAEEAGLQVSLLAEEATIDSLVKALCEWNENNPRRIKL